MSRFFKSALFPILIVIVLAFFASKLISRSDQAPARSFAGFLEQVENGQVQTATLKTKDNSIDVRLKGTDKNKYQVGYPARLLGRAGHEAARSQGGRPDPGLRRQARRGRA